MPFAKNGDISIAYETFGSAEGLPLLLVGATDAQMLMFPEALCRTFVDAGFQVTRFDHRDAGCSTHLDGVAAPSPLRAALFPSTAPYHLTDMAADAVAVLDAPVRPGRRRRSGRPAEVAIYRLMGSPGFPLDEDMIAEIGRRSYERHPADPESGRRQLAAVAASPDRRKALSGLRMPALVVHGDDDLMMRPKAGRATAAAIPGARLVCYPGMGHDLPAPLWPSVVGEIRKLAQEGEQLSPGR